MYPYDISIQKSSFVSPAALGLLQFFCTCCTCENTAIYRTGATLALEMAAGACSAAASSKWPLWPAPVLPVRSKRLLGPALAVPVPSEWSLSPALLPPVRSKRQFEPVSVPQVRSKWLFQDCYSKMLVSVTLCSEPLYSALLYSCMDMHGFTLYIATRSSVKLHTRIFDAPVH